MDTLIAGTALANKGTLVTHNAKEFSREPLAKLSVDEWQSHFESIFGVE